MGTCPLLMLRHPPLACHPLSGKHETSSARRRATSQCFNNHMLLSAAHQYQVLWYHALKAPCHLGACKRWSWPQSRSTSSGSMCGVALMSSKHADASGCLQEPPEVEDSSTTTEPLASAPGASLQLAEQPLVSTVDDGNNTIGDTAVAAGLTLSAGITAPDADTDTDDGGDRAIATGGLNAGDASAPDATFNSATQALLPEKPRAGKDSSTGEVQSCAMVPTPKQHRSPNRWQALLCLGVHNTSPNTRRLRHADVDPVLCRHAGCSGNRG